MGGGDTFNVTPERIEAVRHQLGLDEPVPIRYAKWLGNAITGDLGTSYRTRQAVSDAISERLPVTIQLMIMAQLLACAFALIVAPLAASRPNRLYDRATTTLTFGMLDAGGPRSSMAHQAAFLIPSNSPCLRVSVVNYLHEVESGNPRRFAAALG